MTNDPARRKRPGPTVTRAAILEAARDLFATNGYSTTSIRSIAAAAEVDPALVHHYFGTKEGLFRAALEVPIDPANLMASVGTATPDDLPLALARMFLGVWDSPDTGPAMLALIRRGIAEPETSGMLREFFGDSVLGTATGSLLRDVEPAEAERRIALTMSHLVGIAVLRHVIGLDALARWPAEDLARTIAPTLGRYLRGEATTPDPTSTPTDRPVDTEEQP